LDIPIVISAVGGPVESGLVESLGRPGGNITGVQVFDTNLKALEWLSMISPGIKKVFMPYDENDSYLIMNMDSFQKGASKMGIKLIPYKVHSVEETVTAIEGLPKDIDAIFRIPAPVLGQRNSELSRAAIKRGLPTCASVPLDEDVLITLASDFYSIGKQTSRMTNQILQGIKPADLPIETAEVFLIVNLKTAKKIGFTIPYAILLRANKIIR
jgi:putative ABC transport system substrate-binding protein